MNAISKKNFVSFALVCAGGGYRPTPPLSPDGEEIVPVVILNSDGTLEVVNNGEIKGVCDSRFSD